MVGYNVGEVNKRDRLRLYNLFGPLAVITRAAFNTAVLPNIPDSQRQNYRGSSGGFSILNESAHIPAESMNNFVLSCKEVINFLRFLAQAGKRASCPAIVVDLPRVIMAELNQDKIAGFHICKDVFPKTFRKEGSAASA